MIRSKLLRLFQKHKVSIFFSIVISVIFGVAASLAPIPWVASLNIDNSEDFFSIPSLKQFKSEMPLNTSAVIMGIQDSSLENLLKKTVIKPEWVEKNIAPVYAVTKTDTKELMDPSSVNEKEAVSRYALSAVAVSMSDYDDALAKKGARWIGEMLIRLAFRKRYVEILQAIRNENEIIYSESSELTPKLSLSMESINTDLSNLKELIKNNSELTKGTSVIQFDLSSRVEKEDKEDKDLMIYRPKVNMTYLPLNAQVYGLEIQMAQIQNQLNIAEFKEVVSKELVLASNTAIQQIMSAAIDDLSIDKKFIHDYWKTPKLMDSIKHETSSMRRNYISNLINAIETKQQILGEHYIRQLGGIDLIFIEPKFKRTILVISSIILGLLLPLIVKFAPKAISRLVE